MFVRILFSSRPKPPHLVVEARLNVCLAGCLFLWTFANSFVGGLFPPLFGPTLNLTLVTLHDEKLEQNKSVHQQRSVAANPIEGASF